MERCAECGRWPYGGAPECRRCLALADSVVENGYQAFLAEHGLDDDPALAEMIVDEIKGYDWRVVDAAYERLTCTECGNSRGRGPSGCGPCDLDEGFRYAAREVDRPGVMSRNEHAIRVGIAVLRNGHRHSPMALLSWQIGLPLVLGGQMPTTPQAQAVRARINKGATYEELAAARVPDYTGWDFSPWPP
ncbi:MULTISPECIES: hypothetical protein [Nonomuraea]|uniref:Uncharacterized protein n=1 Tax=Nonomuraea mangrovi TaxID=2316207 RepID=A0ABW4T6S4_9ACTN